MVAPLAFLANPAFYAGAGKVASSILPFLGGGSGGGGGNMTAVNVSQNVQQSQATNIGAPSGFTDELAYFLGASPVTTLPSNTGGASSHIDGLYSDVFGQSPTTAEKPSGGFNLNQILLYVALGLGALVIFKRFRKKGR